MDGNKTLSCSITAPEEASTFDELLMRHTLTFADNLKELKNLSTQLYSAAEHFERSYSREDRKQLVVETAKEYVNNAIVNTVDHLGSVAYKVTNFLDEKVDEFSGTELQKGHSSFQPSSPGAFSFSKIVSYKELGSFKCPCFSILTILIQRYLGLVSQMR
ncbi:hypothetical protein RHGRI_019890 [Rhododendron griersonianum]|uniref:Uncharacterized protein n=1 Tax=Rhododendron griersonianum TaxID=479676 RepID=A0AAV6JI99_9ERIC|nr:hypothetical protein RHGRI_019890 [Rhododendron griersonianum]